MMPTILQSPVPCSRCGSTLTYVNPDGDLGCAKCGHIQYTLTPTKEREYKRRKPKDTSRGQGLTATVALGIRRLMFRNG